MSTILLEKPPETPHKPASTPKAAIARTPGRSSEWLVVLTVLGMFVLLELGFRFAGQKLSKDIAHLRSFPEIAAELAEMPASNGTRVLFLGNSLTRYGVDPNTFRDVLQQKYGQVVQGIKLNPDNTALADWFYAYRTYFSRRGIKPDVLIIGFEGGHLRDAASHHPDRLAHVTALCRIVPSWPATICKASRHRVDSRYPICPRRSGIEIEFNAACWTR